MAVERSAENWATLLGDVNTRTLSQRRNQAVARAHAHLSLQSRQAKDQARLWSFQSE